MYQPYFFASIHTNSIVYDKDNQESSETLIITQLTKTHLQFLNKIKGKRLIACNKTDQRVAFTGLEREPLLVHRMGVELGKRVGRAAESGVHTSIHLIQPRRV